MDWFQLIISLLTLLTAVSAALVTWMQHALSQKQFRHELYQRRLPVYHAAVKCFLELNRTGRPSMQVIDRFRLETSEARFLFGREANRAIDSYYSGLLGLLTLWEEQGSGSGPPLGMTTVEYKKLHREFFQKKSELQKEKWGALDDALLKELAIETGFVLRNPLRRDR